KGVPIGLGPFEPGPEFDKIAVGQRGLERVQFILKLPQGPEHFLPVLPEDFNPHRRVAGTEPGGLKSSGRTGRKCSGPCGSFRMNCTRSRPRWQTAILSNSGPGSNGPRPIGTPFGREPLFAWRKRELG